MNKVIGFIRIEIPAGKASAAPPLGPALGMRGLNIMQFAKSFNDLCRANGYKENTPVPTIITVYQDKTYTFRVNPPSVSYLLKNTLNIKKGASKGMIANATDLRLVYEVAKIKSKDSFVPLHAICKSVYGSCRSMGLDAK